MAGSNGTSPGGGAAPDAALQPGEWERVLVLGLATLRKARGWRQHDLARRSGLHRRTIMRLEGAVADRMQPTQQTITALARAFGYVHLSDLWTALQATNAGDPGTPLVVGERIRRMVLAFLDCTPQQQQCVEGVILWWAARQQAEALGQAHLLDMTLISTGG